MGKLLTFQQIRDINQSRSTRWHSGGKREWGPTDWSNAMMGEGGEACNAIKKLMRIRDGLMSISEAARHYESEAEALEKVGDELADTFLYIDLLAGHLNIDLVKHIIKVFNKKSEEYGFPERL